MKNILVLGAGQSASFMIDYLLKQSEKYDWFVTVGDKDIEFARKAVKRHPHGDVIAFDVNDAEYPDDNNKIENITSTFIEYGNPGGFTAIAKTVGLPAALAAKLILTDDLPISGCHIPTHPAVFSQVLPELNKEGLVFKEKIVVNQL